MAPGKINKNCSVLFDLDVYLIGMGHESRRNCFLFGKIWRAKSDYPALSDAFFSPLLIHHLWLKTTLTAH